MPAVLQVALDFVDMDRALKLAREAASGGAEWLEAGTPLIKSVGLDAVRKLRAEFPRHTIVADMKTMDAGRAEMEMAAKAGANVAVVLGVCSDATVRECVEAGRNYGMKVAMDLVRVSDPAARAQWAENEGIAFVIYHTPIDEQMEGRSPFARLSEIAHAVSIPVAVAGGINTETAAEAIRQGAGIVIVGGALTKAKDAAEAVRQMRQVLETGIGATTSLYKRAAQDDVRSVLEKVSTANISDGSHRMPTIYGLRPLSTGLRIVGRAVTVRTAPGDWAKPVEAIDHAKEGEVLVISSSGTGPAVWGELATNSAIQRKLAGVIIDGAARDTGDIRKLGFPLFVRLIMPNAGEPKGFGEIGVPVIIDGIRVETGDWIVADDDGIVVIPARRAVEIANHAMDCLEKENRIREEISGGKKTLAQVQELLKWEKK
jgi:3-hexulose-6-phosphate synthase / 6-phospho-3-hexuloisomerase